MARLANLLEEVETANGDMAVTFFEVTTAAAMLAFSRVPADLLLLETGLGGALDSTNVLENTACHNHHPDCPRSRKFSWH